MRIGSDKLNLNINVSIPQVVSAQAFRAAPLSDGAAGLLFCSFNSSNYLLDYLWMQYFANVKGYNNSFGSLHVYPMTALASNHLKASL
jgi:hypothetical protein